MTTQTVITLSIVSHGNAMQISRLLASLQKYEHTAQFQLILTNNLRDDLPDFDPAPWISLHTLRNDRPLGFAQNHNRAFELAMGTYFAILNPDLIFEQSVFEQLIASLQKYQADMIAPKIVDENGITQDSFRTMPSPSEIIRRRLPGYKFEEFQPDSEGLIQPDWIAGMFWLMGSDVYRQLGGMDERYRLYFEDVDFCTRARLKGMKLLVDSKVQVRHDAQRSSRKKLYYLFLHTQSAIRFFSSPIYRQALRQNKK
jgi:N-acetylglucosaminyl-diphospho-decaprenol L-rhamnosyltransferase